MHYGRTLFSIDPATLDVLVPLPTYIYEYYNRIGNFALSVGDRAGAAHLYGPPTIAPTNVVTNTADSGPGSLRAAMYYANDHPGTTVRFAIPTSDPGLSNGFYTIYVSGQLPALVANGTVIDATTEPGYSGSPIVAIDASKVLPQTEFTIGGIYIYAGNCVARGLAIDNFTDSGINLLYNYCVSNSVQACYIGVAPNGTTAAPNDYEGIDIGVGARANVIGGTSASQRNVISGNSGYGITITSTNSGNNVISGNYIGLNAAGTASVSNTYNGIGIWGGANSNVIGPSNVISGNYDYGIYISDNNTAGTVVKGNFIGTDARGMNPVPNTYMGVGVWNGAFNTVIGGTTAGARNVISGNGNNGISTGFGLSGGNVIEGNYIGVASNGLTAIPNNGDGVYVESSLQSNMISSNVISGNASDGIFFYAATNDAVAGNYIGLGSDGVTAVGNSQLGIYILGSQSNWIGGGNIVSGNASDGIQLWGEGTSYNTVEGNFIGATKTGLTGAGNSGSGLSMIAGPQNNLITGNVVGANGNYGVAFEGAGTSGNVVQGNYIGVAANGTTPLGNTWQGVMLDGGASDNTIGLGLNGSGTGNIIANNPYDGLILYDTNTLGNSIRGNSIYSNGSPAIFLVGSGESGPNDLEPYPVLTSASVFTNTMVIAGTVNGAANHTILIDIYRNRTPDSSGYGQGQTYAGTATAQTGSGGTGSFSLPFAALLPGQYFSATATDVSTGNTSQFSLDLESTNKSGMGPGQLVGSSYSSHTGFSFDITLATNENYTIQMATNLATVPVNWVNVTNFFATSPSNKITDASATNSKVRFYRAVTP